MEDLKSAVREHVELIADLVERISAELRSSFRPAYDNFVGFFHAIDWKVTLLCQSDLGSMTENAAITMISLIKSFIGHFDHDPNHIFDVATSLKMTRHQKRKIDETHVEGHEELDAASLREHEEFTKVKNISTIELGRYEIETCFQKPLGSSTTNQNMEPEVAWLNPQALWLALMKTASRWGEGACKTC